MQNGGDLRLRRLLSQSLPSQKFVSRLFLGSADQGSR